MTAGPAVGIALVVLLYREVVSVYTRAGGSYVVARENFGPRVAQVAAVALLIDYVVTVAVQTAAGSAAIVSAFPQLATSRLLGDKIVSFISVIAILIMCYGNLRGIREAGRTFALPTYLFSGAVGLMIVVGLIRELLRRCRAAARGRGVLHRLPRASRLRPADLGRFLRAAARVRQRRLLADRDRGGLQRGQRAAAARGPQRPPDPGHPGLHRGLPDRGHLLAGARHPRGAVRKRLPDGAGPGSQARSSATPRVGWVLFYAVQAGTALILFTGGNTSFSGFPFLASFVAEDSFLPRWLTKRGHRLVFSNGIIVLTVVSLTPADRRRGGGQQPDPVLRDRRVHRLHHGRVRHGQVPPAEQGARLAAPRRDQHHRRHLHRRSSC